MSCYYCKIKIKTTGKIFNATALDDYFGSHRYGYKVDGMEKILNENEVEELGMVEPKPKFNQAHWNYPDETETIKLNTPFGGELKKNPSTGKPKELDLKEQWLIHTYKNVDSDANENIKKLIKNVALDDWKFIQSLLTQQRTELLEEIKGLRHKDNLNPFVSRTRIDIYNQAIKDVINLLNKKD